MKWIAISGSWRTINKKVKTDVRHSVTQIVSAGDGIITGGALGVDFIATDEALVHNPQANQIKIFLPTSLTIYSQHYLKRAKEGVITPHQANSLISQLQTIKDLVPPHLIEGSATRVDQQSYYYRHNAIVSHADELYSFQVNHSQGTQDTINKARVKNIPITLFTYTI